MLAEERGERRREHFTFQPSLGARHGSIIPAPYCDTLKERFQ
jgi:hypothetical protein